MSNSKYFIYVLSFTIFLLPQFVFSAQLYLTASTDTLSVGDTIIVHAYLDTEGSKLNVVDGTIKVSSFVDETSLTLSTENSILTLWPQKPEFQSNKSQISFVGGAPEDFQSSKAKLFDIVVSPKIVKDIVINPVIIQGYLGDGKGTLVSIKTKDVSFHVVPKIEGQRQINEWTEALQQDALPPKAFSITAGSDASLYDGQQFIVFQTSDVGSGIDHYEVVEGKLPSVISGEQYVLKNQGVSERVTVTAFDKAGNSTQSHIDIKQSQPVKVSYLIGILFLFISLLLVVLYRSKLYEIDSK